MDKKLQETTSDNNDNEQEIESEQEEENEENVEKSENEENEENEKIKNENKENEEIFFLPDKDAFLSHQEYDSSSDDAEMDEKEEENLTRHILNQLMYLNKMTRNKKKQKEKRFIPSVKNFLKLNYEQKIDKVTTSEFLVKNLIKLTEGVVNKKIHVADINRSDLRMLEHICDTNAPYVDKKAILAEDHRVHMILKDALKEVEREQKRLLQKNGKQLVTN